MQSLATAPHQRKGREIVSRQIIAKQVAASHRRADRFAIGERVGVLVRYSTRQDDYTYRTGRVSAIVNGFVVVAVTSGRLGSIYQASYHPDNIRKLTA